VFQFSGLKISDKICLALIHFGLYIFFCCFYAPMFVPLVMATGWIRPETLSIFMAGVVCGYASIATVSLVFVSFPRG